jgi:metallo-beta-lactamase class B
MLAGVSLMAQRDSGERAAWNEPVKPFRVIGNVYYVGVSGVSSFLITTPQGHILLDGGFPETAPLIEKNIATLGFRIQDVKVLLNSDAHYDHCGGLAELKRLSRAQMVASRADAEVLESGGRISFEGWRNSGFPTVKVDRVIADGETVKLGDVTLTAVLTPGHTKGCTTWTMPVAESGKTYHVVFYGSTSVPGYQLVNNPKYPQIVSDYERSLRSYGNFHATCSSPRTVASFTSMKSASGSKRAARIHLLTRPSSALSSISPNKIFVANSRSSRAMFRNNAGPGSAKFERSSRRTDCCVY